MEVYRENGTGNNPLYGTLTVEPPVIEGSQLRFDWTHEGYITVLSKNGVMSADVTVSALVLRVQ